MMLRTVSNFLLLSTLLLVTSSAFTLNHPPSRAIFSVPPSTEVHNQETFHHSQLVSLFLTNGNSDSGTLRIRHKLRRITGLSLSALRGTLRASTGFSLTAARTASRGLTGVSVTKIIKSLTAIFPSSIRYFMQPFFILYFTPIMILKNLCDSPARAERLAAHEKLVEGWKDAIKQAENLQNGKYWPIRVNVDGEIETVELPSSESEQNVKINDAIVDSLDVSLLSQDLKK